MKILDTQGNYTCGIQTVELDNGTIEKRSLYVDTNRRPAYYVLKSWPNLEAYLKVDTVNIDEMVKRVLSKF